MKEVSLNQPFNFWHGNSRVVIGSVLLTKEINLFVMPKFLQSSSIYISVDLSYNLFVNLPIDQNPKYWPKLNQFFHLNFNQLTKFNQFMNQRKHEYKNKLSFSINQQKLYFQIKQSNNQINPNQVYIQISNPTNPTNNPTTTMQHPNPSLYLSMLSNPWPSFPTDAYDHHLTQDFTCSLAQDHPGIKDLKEKYPQINVEIQNMKIKPLKSGVYIGELNEEGKPEGYGVIRYEDKSIVEARFQDGKANGKGFKWFGDDWYYIGDFLDNCFDGRGEYLSPSVAYVGQFKNNTFHGHGQLTLASNKGKFIGEMQHGQMKQGTLTWEFKKNKFQYEGTFKDGLFHGSQCKLRSNIGEYRGDFIEGRKQGKGRFQYKEKYQYVGEYENNLKSGQGTLYNPEIRRKEGEEQPEFSELERNISYRGSFVNNIPNGPGQIFKENEGRLVSAQYIEGIWSEALKNLE